MGELGIIYVALALLGFVVAILWICVPFILMGINTKLSQQNSLTRKLISAIESRQNQ